MINQFYKRKILTTGFANCSKGKNEQNTKCSTQSNNHNKSVNGDRVNSPQGSSNTHDPFQYSIISVCLAKCLLPRRKLLRDSC